MRISTVRKHLILAVLLLVSTACQAGSPQAHSTPRPSVSPSPTVDAQRCARLAKVGFSTCPPTPDKLQVPQTTFKNLTDGAVDDTTAQKWGRAFQMTEGYYRWAMDANDRQALTEGAFSDPEASGNLFGYDLRDLDKAKQQGGTLILHWEQIPRVQLVSIPDSLKVAMTRQGLKPRPYGLAVEFTGPASWDIKLPNGQLSNVESAPASFVSRSVIWGEYRTDPDLGPIWYESGLYGCDAEVAVVCRF